MNRIRLRRLAPVALTLALFVGWLGVSALHHHVDQPGCEICKILHGDVAQLSIPLASPEPGDLSERLIVVADTELAETVPPQHQVRGPPIS